MLTTWLADQLDQIAQALCCTPKCARYMRTFFLTAKAVINTECFPRPKLEKKPLARKVRFNLYQTHAMHNTRKTSNSAYVFPYTVYFVVYIIFVHLTVLLCLSFSSFANYEWRMPDALTLSRKELSLFTNSQSMTSPWVTPYVPLITHFCQEGSSCLQLYTWCLQSSFRLITWSLYLAIPMFNSFFPRT